MRKSDILHETIRPDPAPEQVKRLMPRGLRRLLAFVLILALLFSLLVTVAAFRPFTLTLPTPMYAFSQSIAPAYSVNLTPNAQYGSPSLPAGRIYVRGYTESVSVRFDMTQRAFWLGNLASRSQAEALLQVFSAENPAVMLMERKTSLLPAEDLAPTPFGQSHNRSVTVPLAPYREAADAFLRDSKASGNAILTVRLTAELAGSRFGQSIASPQAADVAIPLSADAFQIATVPAAGRQFVFRPIRYLVQPEGVPLFIYPLASLLVLLALVLFLALTTSRPVLRFQRELNQLLRQGRRQILMIADKAWEPEWCVTVSDFSSMVQTARRLRHPIFCYVDREAPEPAAYFYVYYGENNYCYVFDGKPAARPARLQPVPALAAPGEPARGMGGLSEPAYEGLAAPVPMKSAATDPGARFQTEPFKLPAAEAGSGPITVVPAVGPMVPSPEAYLDLIRGPWPGETLDAEDDPEAAAAFSPMAAAPVASDAAASGRSGPATGQSASQSVGLSASQTAGQPDPAARRPAGDESNPVPILPETDAGLFRTALF